MAWWLLYGNVILLTLIWVYCRLSCGICRCSRHLVGKTVIVTGANSGIGFETAKNMAERGARVILACRSPDRGIQARDDIIKATRNTDVHFHKLDLASLCSVRNFAYKILATENGLDILINNAGVYLSENEKTEDGLLLGMQVNHFGPFLLTNLLLPLLKASAPSRIITVSSVAAQRGRIDFEDLNGEKGDPFHSTQVHSNSKLCNILMTVELDKLLKGTGVTANCLHPGFVETNISGLNNRKGPLKYILMLLSKAVGKDAWEGAQTSIYLAAAPEVADLSGRYFRDCFEVKPTKLALDRDIAHKLWEISKKLVGIK